MKNLEKFEKILKPKSKREISKEIIKLILASSTWAKFIENHKNCRKSYERISKLIRKSPEELIVIFNNNILYDKISEELNDFLVNETRKKIDFLEGPFAYALVYKNFLALLQGNLPAFLITPENVLEILT